MDIQPLANQPLSVHAGTSDAPRATVSSQELSAPVGQSPDQKLDSSHRKQSDPQQVQESVTKINDTILSLSRDIQFSVDQDTGREVVKVVDTRTNSVIRQIPSEEVLAIAKRLDELKGLIIHQKA